MKLHELRSLFLQHMQEHGHVIIPSASLVPENDPTTLFTGSGMQPMLPYLLGEAHPLGTRIADSQQCFRSGDIEEVGDNRHTTSFEMLGNWSLGDFFQAEQIPMMWSFLTGKLGLDPSRLYFTCYQGNESLGIPRDTISAELWQTAFASVGITATTADDSEALGMQGARIFYYGDKKNWWSRVGAPKNMPSGEPGGPDTEMFYDFDPSGIKNMHETSAWSAEPCHVNCDCGRFVEIGNNVFMAYQKVGDDFKLLPKRNVDFGGGLERLLMAVRDNSDIFTGDMFDSARASIATLCGKGYGESGEVNRAYRVILDHLKAATFLVADGVFPGNKDQGYFVRRLIRRAVRFGGNLGIHESFTRSIVESFIRSYQDAYPNLAQKQEVIVTAIGEEEAKFRKTLEKGIKEFEKRATGAMLSGPVAFELFATYGFPIELTEELAAEKGMQVDRAAFDTEKQKHTDLSRSASTAKFKGGLGDTSEMSVKYHTATHLLHTALRTVLGAHVEQRGSNITPERLRFDFSHPSKMTPEEITKVEEIVNAEIKRAHNVTYQDMPIEQARALGAIGVFEDKYGELVRVYSVGDFSKEFCGGPHVENTGTMGHFRIVKEEACSAGIRRVKAVLE